LLIKYISYLMNLINELFFIKMTEKVFYKKKVLFFIFTSKAYSILLIIKFWITKYRKK
jgi:hypothetical protein